MSYLSKYMIGKDLYQDEVLNLGVSPKQLIAHARTRFLALGGTLFEGTTFCDGAP